MSRGVFITFEGGEGSGKSTQIALLADRLTTAGAEVVRVREPGGTLVGDRVRDLLLDPAHTGLDPRAELLLYEASRAALVAEVIAPALERGAVVLCDRFFDSTVAYQGAGRGLDASMVRTLNAYASAGLTPDVTIVLDIDPVVGLERATGMGADRLEAEDVVFHQRVRAGFLALAAEEPDRMVVVDADRCPEDVEAGVAAAVRAHPATAALLR
jgi:dTMP kinase